MQPTTQTVAPPAHFITARNITWTDLENHGVVPVLTKFGTKEPAFKGYAKRYETNPNLRDSDRKLPGNLAALLGQTFVDIDLENQEIVKVAGYFLPKTAYEWGRVGHPRSHRMYRAPNGEKKQTFVAPNGELVLEVRSGDCLSTIPPSQHPSGEQYTYTSGVETLSLDEAAEIDYDLLYQTSSVTVFTYGLLEFYQKGSRDSLVMAGVGILAKHGFPQELAEKMVRALIGLSGDEEGEARLKKVETIYNALGDPNQNVAGYKFLASLCGELFKDWARKTLRKAAPVGGIERPDLIDVAEYLSDEFSEEMAYNQSRGVFCRWVQTHWEPMADKGETRGWLDVAVPRAMRAVGYKLTAVSQIDGALRVATPAMTRDFVTPRYWVNFQNGILDVNQWEMHPHSKEYGFTSVIGYDIQDGPCPLIDKFLQETIPDPRSIAIIEEHVGLAMLGDMQMHKAVILVGPTRSGKSTVANLGVLACGEDIGQQPGAMLLSEEVEGLRARATWGHLKLANISEFPADGIRQGEIFKALTAHESVTARQMYMRESAKNRWQPKLIMTTNEAPRFIDPGAAISNRLIVIDAPYAKTAKELDPYLLERLEAEVPQWGARCLLRARGVLERGKYTVSVASQTALIQLVFEGDPIQYWAAERLIRDPEGWTDTEALFDSYKIESAKLGKGVAQRQRMVSGMLNVYPGLVRTRGKSSDGFRPWGYKGVRFRVPSDPDFEPPTVVEEGE